MNNASNLTTDTSHDTLVESKEDFYVKMNNLSCFEYKICICEHYAKIIHESCIISIRWLNHVINERVFWLISTKEIQKKVYLQKKWELLVTEQMTELSYTNSLPSAWCTVNSVKRTFIQSARCCRRWECAHSSHSWWQTTVKSWPWWDDALTDELP